MMNHYSIDSDTSSIQEDFSNQQAIQKIKLFCQPYRFNNAYQNKLIERYNKEKRNTDVTKWFDNQLLMKTQEEVMKSIKKFIEFLEKNDALRIEVEDNQLDLHCRVNLGDTFGYIRHGIMQISSLQETIYYNFHPEKYKEQDIPNKIQSMFRKLYDCLKFFLYRYFDGNNNPIDEIDFLLFSEEQLKEMYKQKKIVYQTNHKPILIGGLFACCYRFFRVIFEFFLSYDNLFLIPDIQQRSRQFCESGQRFPMHVHQWIRDKVKDIRKYEKQEQEEIQKQINQEMDGFVYENLYDHFMANASTSPQKLYESQTSICLYRWQKITSKIQKFQKIQTSLDQTYSTQLQPCQYFAKGIFQPNQIGVNINQQSEDFIEILSRNQPFQNIYKIDRQKYKMRKFIHAERKQFKKDFITVQKSGHFGIYTQKQEDLKLALQYLQQVYKNYKIKTVEKIYKMKGHLGMTNIKLSQLIFAPFFAGKLDLAISRNLQSQEDANNQKDYIFYKFYNPIWNNVDKTFRKQQMTMQINKNGVVIITGVKDLQFAKKQYEKVKQDLKDFINREKIKEDQQKKRQQKLNQYAKLTILSDPTKSNLAYKSYSKDQDHWHTLYSRNALTYQNKEAEHFKKFPRKTLKVLTWNIKGYRKDDELKEIKNQKRRMESQENLQKQDKIRFETMINVIKYHNPDIVCLQEGYSLYRFNEELFQQFLKTNFNQQQYYYAEYIPLDIPPQDINGNDLNRNQRTIILSKFPVKFSNLFCGYKNKKKETRFKLSVVADFQILIEPQQKPLSILVASVHLKSGEPKFGSDDIRQFQFNFLDELSQNFDISIFAGDFNTYDEPFTPSQQLSKVAKLIKQKGYIDFEKYLVSKEASKRSKDYPPSVLDKILIKFKNSQLKDRLKVQDIRLPGSFTMQRFKNQNWRLVYSDKMQRSLSDHIGRYVEFGFKK